jgi:outer membrane protein OmpA-like peptidoglycan-associated protein
LKTTVAIVCLAAALAGCATRELYVVMPEEGGKVGSVLVTRNGEEILLQGPHSALSSSSAKPFTADPDQVARTFGPALAATPLRPVTYILFFIEGSEELVRQSRAEVDGIYAEIVRRPAPEITVVGHTDTVGSDAYNDGLSLRRAQRIRRDLIALGIPAEKIVAVGRGRRELIVPTPENIRQARNRRVEIHAR